MSLYIYRRGYHWAMVNMWSCRLQNIHNHLWHPKNRIPSYQLSLYDSVNSSGFWPGFKGWVNPPRIMVLLLITICCLYHRSTLIFSPHKPLSSIDLNGIQHTICGFWGLDLQTDSWHCSLCCVGSHRWNHKTQLIRTVVVIGNGFTAGKVNFFYPGYLMSN